MKKNDKRFSIFIGDVAKKDVNEVRKYVLYYCKISPSCYYKWLQGAATPSIERREMINSIAFKYGYPIVYAHNKGYRKQSKLIEVWKQT